MVVASVLVFELSKSAEKVTEVLQTGMYLGQNSVHLNVVRLMHGTRTMLCATTDSLLTPFPAFSLGPALDSQGKPIPVDTLAMTDGFNSRPKPFPCSIKPRSEQARKLIEREFADAQDGLRAYE